MKSNFSFLENNFSEYFKLAQEAERNMITAPRTSVMYARLTLEELIKWMYTYDSKLIGTEPAKSTLEGLMYNSSFKLLISEIPGLLEGLTSIRKNGNQALHNKADVLMRYAHNSVNNLYEFCKWIHYTYVDNSVRLPMSLDNELIPRESEVIETVATAKALQSRLEAISANAEKVIQQKDEELKKLREEVAAVKAANKAKPAEAFTLNPSTEAETRRILIDVMLRELGWNPEGEDVPEFEVYGMPNKTGIGYVDYVLWGDNGLPLAVVEIKNTLHDPHKGQQQAKLYADCLQNKYGRRPIIFYSNGYKTWIWDDTIYPTRPISGFYTKDELEWTIDKRTKKSLLDAEINPNIAGRPYQKRALKRVAETFEAKHRKALLVMATGTGKTRVAIALTDMMMRHKWARRILFLADRNALVIQAKNNYVRELPSLSSVDITKEKENIELNRMVFSTYPTMMNKIDSERLDELLLYSPAHFDMIIIDEAHRSVYQKYQAIFRYFDAILVGLTATPKSDVDKNTYELFDLENHNPTDFYELDQAVTDGWLVPPKKIAVATKFLREGIKYKDLSEDEKLEYEEKFFDEVTGTLPEEIDPEKLNKFVFNKDTVDKVLNQLMTEGIKIEGGDKIGKTIIFAKNHPHALFVEERFNLLYPHLMGGFLRVIDNYEDYAQTLIEDFSAYNKNPQIAVSVDMLDTGIDIPEILNLVFFKVVRSSSKFWQMIGRGTRLCPGVFGIPQDEDDKSQDKKEFLIFDYCGNFEFFDVTPDGYASTAPQSISQRIIQNQILLAHAISSTDLILDDKYQTLHKELMDKVHQSILNLNRNSFVVKEVLQDVDKYSVRDRLNHLTGDDISILFQNITPLVEPMDKDEDARRFDVMMLNFMLLLFEADPRVANYINKVKSISKTLLKKTNLPIVKQKESTLKELVSEDFWQNNLSVLSLEHARNEIRDLVRLIEKEKRKVVYSNIEDVIFKGVVSDVIPTYKASDNYKQRVERYVRENENFLVIQKLKKNIPITTVELRQLEEMMFDGAERGTKDDFIKEYGEQPLGWFIRSIVGMDVNAAKMAFGDFLNTGNLSADQIHFIDTIIDFLSTKGVIDKKMLFEVPFKNFHTEGLMGVFDEDSAKKVIQILENINHNAVA